MRSSNARDDFKGQWSDYQADFKEQSSDDKYDFKGPSSNSRLTTIRLLYSTPVLLNLRVTQLDVETAFLNAALPADKQIDVEHPPLMDLSKGKCYRLQQTLSELKQSPQS